MRGKRLVFLLSLSIAAASSREQDARSVLQASARKYAALTRYYVQGTREWTSADEIQRYWNQEHFVIASSGTASWAQMGACC
jgi:hypothetical protein